MLELDLLLERFLERGYPALDERGKAAFADLLERPDQSLQAWLLGGAVPMDREVRAIVEHIRNCPAED